MNLSKITLYHVSMNLKSPFVTHAGAVKERESILIEAVDVEGRSGWGECVAFSTPFYTAETVATAWNMMLDVFIPKLKTEDICHPQDINRSLSIFQGNQMAKAGIEAAFWDLYAKQNNQSLAACIGGTRKKIDVGVVISLNDQLDRLLNQYLEDGYSRFKLKVQKGREREMIEELQRKAPGIPVMIDGNGMYNERDIDLLAQLDDLGLMMIEQPLVSGDFYMHKQLQENIDTPICLDESIESFYDAKQALQMKSCRVINIKIGRVGGLTEAIRIHDYCAAEGVPVWCGGMLETGISRAHNIALASLENFTIPGDISASKRYWERDVIEPEVIVENGKVTVPEGPGIGFNVDREYIEYLSKEIKSISLKK